MGNIALRIIIRRFLELFLTSTVVSVVLTLLNLGKILAGKNTLLVGMTAGVLVFAAMNFKMLRNCYFDLRDKFLYYTSNVAAYALFAMLGVVVYLISPSRAYTWLFAVTKFLRYTNAALAVPYSAAAFHLIGLLVIFLAPIGMGWIFIFDDDDE